MVPWDEPSHWDGQLKRTGAHSAVVTAAKVHDKPALPHLLHGKEQRVYGNSAYASQTT